MSASVITENSPLPLFIPSDPIDAKESHTQLPSVISLIKDFGNINARFLESNWGSLVDLSAEKCISIMEAFLQKKQIEAKFSPGDYGEIIASEIPIGGSFVVNGDLHSDMKALIRRLSYLVHLEILDDQYQITPNNIFNSKIVFLGDYFGRGTGAVNLFMLLLLFKLENWCNVDLYRGNHESLMMLPRDLKGRDLELFHNEKIEDLLGKVFSTLTVRGYYCCSTPSLKGRKQYCVLTHGVPGFYPSAKEVFEKGRVVFTASDQKKMFSEIKSLAKEDLGVLLKKIWGIEEGGSAAECYNIQIHAKRVLVAIHLMPHLEKHEETLTNGGIEALLELWGDVYIGDDFAPNFKRGCNYTISPKIVKYFLELQSYENHKTLAVIKGHGHHHVIHGSEKSFLNSRIKGVFLHQLPVSGCNANLDRWTAGIDSFYIIQVQPELKDWEVYILNRSGMAPRYEPIERSFYGENAFFGRVPSPQSFSQKKV